MSVEGQELKASEWVESLLPWKLTKTMTDGKALWFFTATTIRLPGVTHKVRIPSFGSSATTPPGSISS